MRERGDGNLAFDDTGGVSGTWVKEGDRTPDEARTVLLMAVWLAAMAVPSAQKGYFGPPPGDGEVRQYQQSGNTLTTLTLLLSNAKGPIPLNMVIVTERKSRPFVARPLTSGWNSRPLACLDRSV